MSSVEAENAKMRERAKIEAMIRLKRTDLILKIEALPGAKKTPSARVLKAKLSVCDELLKAINHDLPEDRPKHGAD